MARALFVGLAISDGVGVSGDGRRRDWRMVARRRRGQSALLALWRRRFVRLHRLEEGPNGPAKIGEQVFFDMKPNGANAWAGTAYNPEDGKRYTGKIDALRRPSHHRRLRVRRAHLQVLRLVAGEVRRGKELEIASLTPQQGGKRC